MNSHKMSNLFKDIRRLQQAVVKSKSYVNCVLPYFERSCPYHLPLSQSAQDNQRILSHILNRESTLILCVLLVTGILNYFSPGEEIDQ